MRLKSGKILRGLMETKGLSNRDIAVHAEVGRTWISALVNERRTSCKPKVAELIAERLEVPLEFLFVVNASADSGRNERPEEKVA